VLKSRNAMCVLTIESLSTTNRCKEQYPVCIREVYKAAMKEYNDEERGIVRLKNPWGNVTIPWDSPRAARPYSRHSSDCVPRLRQAYAHC